jgi:CheY-like chemotaxis protein
MRAPRILLVDEERDVSEMLHSSLELTGRDYIIVDVASGKEAARELSSGPVDLLVTDFQLRGVSSVQLLEKVRQLYPDAQAIMLTNYPIGDAQKKAEALGVVAFLTKPIRSSLFLKTIDHALKLKGSVTSPIQVQEDEKPRMADRLEAVRRELGAEATLLIDENGRIVVQAGDMTNLDLEAALPSVIAAFNAGLKVSSLMGSLLPGNLQYFDGDSHDLYLTNVGAFYGLLIAFRQGQEVGQMGAVVHYGRRAAEDLLDLLSTSKSIRAEAEVMERARELEKSAKQDASDKSEGIVDSDLDIAPTGVKHDEAEEYWKQAVSKTPLWKQIDTGMLTYREARDLGLLSDEADDESTTDEGEQSA